MGIDWIEFAGTMAILILLGLCACSLVDRIREGRLLRKHQSEWDAIRIRATDEGATKNEIQDMHRDYCNELVFKYGYGKCMFPVCWHESGR